MALANAREENQEDKIRLQNELKLHKIIGKEFIAAPCEPCIGCYECIFYKVFCDL
jgi:hypothetical protein